MDGGRQVNFQEAQNCTGLLTSISSLRRTAKSSTEKISTQIFSFVQGEKIKLLVKVIWENYSHSHNSTKVDSTEGNSFSQQSRQPPLKDKINFNGVKTN